MIELCIWFITPMGSIWMALLIIKLYVILVNLRIYCVFVFIAYLIWEFKDHLDSPELRCYQVVGAWLVVLQIWRPTWGCSFK